MNPTGSGGGSDPKGWGLGHESEEVPAELNERSVRLVRGLITEEPELSVEELGDQARRADGRCGHQDAAVSAAVENWTVSAENEQHSTAADRGAQARHARAYSAHNGEFPQDLVGDVRTPVAAMADQSTRRSRPRVLHLSAGPPSRPTAGPTEPLRQISM